MGKSKSNHNWDDDPRWAAMRAAHVKAHPEDADEDVDEEPEDGPGDVTIMKMGQW